MPLKYCMDVAIIPAYNPDEQLPKLVSQLRALGIENIIVVNDGSDERLSHIFRAIEDSVILLSHEINRGKGSAIKTALKYIRNYNKDNHFHEIQGIVLLDADGQHRPEDAMRLLDAVHQKDSGLVLGVRKFKGDIPVKSLFGNTVTKYVFRIISGIWVTDTQTGLRAFSKDLVSMFLKVNGERYEYEMNVLVTCAKQHIKITEVPITTIYHDKNNSCSHFRAIRDSVRIYGNLLAFSGTSFISFLLDYILFFLLAQVFNFTFPKESSIVAANISARIISGAFNYYLNSTFIFRCKENRYKSIVSYIMLACIILFLNTAILYVLYDYIGLNKAIAKLLTEFMLFVISFTVQKFIIFNKISKKGGPHV
ncbi:glycosyltransferase [Anaerocolumna sedimenticola]|uniref:Glycosyltransferase n=1 Tax=Anaerocolumna sedimenticola TaxID=2696063 RepID=A0A6P1TG91_9FIRM|nr:bifunctional glycosyltransferase family 2/GtrA family protein [Anaerocolumna sedimenticola]QHQ59433.1 glycosyltransferase [Anaerocolumna sedimenticola]